MTDQDSGVRPTPDAGIGGRWQAVNGWLAAEVNGCTCGGTGLDYGPFHQPGCGLEPLVNVGEHAEFLAAEHNAALDAGPRMVPGDTTPGEDEARRCERCDDLLGPDECASCAAEVASPPAPRPDGYDPRGKTAGREGK